MINKLSNEKYNLLLIILIFIIPLLALDFSFYFITKLDYEIKKDEHIKKGFRKAEELAIEGNFGNEFALHFQNFFDEYKKLVKNNASETCLIKELDISTKKIFAKPFPKHYIYIFKIPNKTNLTELIFSNDNEILKKIGKRIFCKIFEYLYKINIKKENKFPESFSRTIFGKFTNSEIIAQEKRGITTNINGIHNNSWFIWDYEELKNKDILGAILICNDINNYAYNGRQLALKNLYTRDKTLGAFIPLYSKYEASVYPELLKKSNLFLDYEKELIINSKENIGKWLINSFPEEGKKLGNYTAYCYLNREDTHIAVVLIKSLNINFFPKWLININFFSLYFLFLILYVWIIYNKLPQFSLKIRFIMSYALASVIPLGLLSVTATGYLKQLERNLIEQTSNELQISLKDFDSYKSNSLREYKSTFTNLINDIDFINLIEKKGINNNSIAKYVVDYFEKNPKLKTELPILGVQIYDENGEFIFSKGNKPSNIDVQALCETFNTALVDILNDEIKKEKEKEKNNRINFSPTSTKKTNKNNSEVNTGELADLAYKTLANRSLKEDINRYFSTPFPKKNSDFCCYQIFDTIKIHNQSKYMLLVIWDDNALDDIILKEAFDNITIRNPMHNFVAYKIKNGKPDIFNLSERIKYEIKDIKEKTDELAKQSLYLKKTEKLVYKNSILVVMPAFNFNKVVFVGWADKILITKSVYTRFLVFIILILISIFTLWICSIRSSSYFLKPITLLKDALDKVSSGNINIGLKNHSKDELGTLSKEFDKMINQLREKERLSKLISDQAVQALEKNSTELFDKTETFNGVALVSDIRNFTGMSEKNDPTIITELLNEHFAEMSKIISENGGMIYKYIGDAIEAVFPEKDDLEKPASIRAFEAGCKMISKLSIINIRRKRLNLFPYKIGVGLCYGSMYAGSVGSIDTRLDYSIIGDPLKNAAKFEALSIQNPSFPIIIGENIAQNLSNFGFKFKKIDNKGQNLNVFTIDEINNISLPNTSKSESLSLKDNQKNELNKSINNSIKYYSFYDNISSIKIKDILLNIYLIIIITLLITFGINIIYNTIFEHLKTESKKDVNRLIKQLECNEVLKSSFDTLCLDFYEEIYKSLNNEDKIIPFKDKIEKIVKKYEKQGYPFTQYYCAYLPNYPQENNIETCIKGIKNSDQSIILDYIKNYKFNKINQVEHKKEANRLIQKLLGKSSNFASMDTVYYRRSFLTNLDGNDVYLNTDRFNDSNNHLIAYIFCFLSKNIDKDKLPYYFTLLAENKILMAIQKGNLFYYSKDFPEDEKKYIQNELYKGKLINKGYIIQDKISIDNDDYTIYAISKELYDFNYSITKITIYTFLISLIFIIIMFIFIEKKLLKNQSIASKLRKFIALSAILPLVIVSFVSYLYIKEQSNIDKSDIRLKLNKLIDEIDNKELYYYPYCENCLKEFGNSKEVKAFVKEISNIVKNNKDIDRKKIAKNKFERFIKSYVYDKPYKRHNKKDLNMFFIIKELIVITKNNAPIVVSDNDKDNPSSNNIEFGSYISKAISNIYFKENEENNNKITNSVENELYSDTFIKILSSVYGNDLCIAMSNFPNNLMIVTNTFVPIGFYIGTFPNKENPDYVIVALILMENDFKSFICYKKNDSNLSYKDYLKSGSKSANTYCFYSTNIDIGNYFFENSRVEDSKTIKELALASSWLDTSYLPISKNVNIKGNKFLEARQGNIIKDNVYAALCSDNPIHEKSMNNLKEYGSIILFSIFLIVLISQCIINDLLSPVKKLMEGAIAVSKGNYKYRTNFSRNDEFGILCKSFDKMMKGLEEKQLINRMVSKTALKGASNSEIKSKKVDVALLYITVPEFDKIMKNNTPDDLFIKLRKHIAIISEIVINNGGDIDKIMGEKLLIAFHLNNNSPNEVAINASKVAYLISSNKELPFRVSVGVNFGEVISGYLGVGEKRDFTIIGDPVNVTARIAVYAEKLESDKLIVSEIIKNLINKQIGTQEQGEVLFKGKTNPAKVYRIII